MKLKLILLLMLTVMFSSSVFAFTDGLIRYFPLESNLNSLVGNSSFTSNNFSANYTSVGGISGVTRANGNSGWIINDLNYSLTTGTGTTFNALTVSGWVSYAVSSQSSHGSSLTNYSDDSCDSSISTSAYPNSATNTIFYVGSCVDGGNTQVNVAQNLNQLAYLTLVFDSGTNWRVYSNGSLIGSASNIADNDGGNPVKFLRYFRQSSYGGNTGNMFISRVAVWNRSLNASEVSLLYSQNGTIISTVSNIQSNSYNGVPLNVFNATATLLNGSTQNLNTTTGNIIINANTTSVIVTSFNATTIINTTITPVANITNVWNYSLINITAFNGITGLNVPNITVNLSAQGRGGVSTINGTSYLAQVTRQLNPTARVTARGYNYADVNLANLTDGANLYNVTLFANNSVLFQIRNLTSNNFVNVSALVVLTDGNNFTRFNTTTNGSILFSDLPPAQYTVEVSASGYNDYMSTVTIGDNTYQTYPIHLYSQTAQQTVFTIRDFSGGDLLEGATLTTEVRPTINASYVLAGIYLSDITGAIPLNYISGVDYRFTLTKTGYQTRQFELKPIIFSTYDVTLVRNQTANVTDDYETVDITILPSAFYNNKINNISFIVTAPLGNLQAFNYTVSSSYNTTPITGQSTDAYGAILTTQYQLNTTLRNDSVYVSYTYVLSSGLSVTHTRIYPINTENPYSMIQQIRQNRLYDISLFDRLLIATMMLIFAVGFAYAFAGEVAGGIAGIGTLVMLGQIGFLPNILVIAVCLISLLILAGRFR